MVGKVQVFGPGVFQVLSDVVLGVCQGTTSVNGCLQWVPCTGVACVSGAQGKLLVLGFFQVRPNSAGCVSGRVFRCVAAGIEYPCYPVCSSRC